MLTRRTILSSPSSPPPPAAPAAGQARPAEKGVHADRPAAPPSAEGGAPRHAEADGAPADRDGQGSGEGSEGPPGPPPEGEAAEGVELLLSRQTLEQTPARAHQFLRGVGTSATIRARLAARGYTKKVHAQGWRLLQATSGFFDEASNEGEADDASVRKAIAEIDAWDEAGFRIINASLRMRHPAQHAFLTRGLRASTGAEAVTGVATLLDRLDALEGAPEREGTREDDRAALATLSERGIDQAERARLRGLLAKAQDFAERFDAPGEREKAERRMREALFELRLWYEEWSEIARVTFKRRDELIRLGLASRRSRRAAGEPGEPGEPGEGPGGEGAPV